MNKTILFVDHDAVRSGSTVSLEYLLRAFVRSGWDVVVHTPKPKMLQKSYESIGVRVIGIRTTFFRTLALSTSFLNNAEVFTPEGLTIAFKDLIKAAYGLVEYLLIIRQTRPAIVYVNEHASIQASVAARLLGIPSVIHLRSRLLQGTRGIRRSFLRRCLLRCNDAVVAITEVEAAELNASPGDAKRIHVVGEFFETQETSNVESGGWKELIGRDVQGMVVCMLGGIQRIKGTLDFLKAAEAVARSGRKVTFIIAGTIRTGGDAAERAHHASCMEYVGRLTASGRLILLGEIERSFEVIRRSSILVAPAIETHFSRPIIEAWGFGVSVITTNLPHNAAIVHDEENGLLVPAADAEALGRAMGRLLDDEALRGAMGQAGRNLVRRCFNASTNTASILNICERIVADGGRNV